MFFQWLKRYVPKGLYGRAALILFVPFLVLQLVVSVTFIQRHFEGVTQQLTANVVLELAYLADQIDSAPDMAVAQARMAQITTALDMKGDMPAAAPLYGDHRRFADLSGRVAMTELHAGLPAITGVDMATDWRAVRLGLETQWGQVALEFHRNRITASNPHQLLVLMVIVGVVMLAISFIFLRNQLRPIRRLARAAEAFGRGEIQPYRLAGAQEVRQAGAAFLEMRARIERQIEQRTLMLSGVSHDLRTPLTRLRLEVSMMDGETADMQHDIEEMERLLDEFLAYARGDALDDPEVTDPAQLVTDLAERTKRGGGQITVGRVDHADVRLRPHAVTRALDNLVGNALRYAGAARISVRVDDKRVVFAVEDAGQGIAPEDRETALKPFARLDAARNQNKGSGVGLGLSITQDIARRHGGQLRLGESADLGGLKAELVIPRQTR